MKILYEHYKSVKNLKMSLKLGFWLFFNDKTLDSTILYGVEFY